MPVITVTGPRQSGKTTLVKNLLPGYNYINLEDIEERSFAMEGSKGFLQTACYFLHNKNYTVLCIFPRNAFIILMLTVRIGQIY